MVPCRFSLNQSIDILPKQFCGFIILTNSWNACVFGCSLPSGVGPYMLIHVNTHSESIPNHEIPKPLCWSVRMLMQGYNGWGTTGSPFKCKAPFSEHTQSSSWVSSPPSTTYSPSQACNLTWLTWPITSPWYGHTSFRKRLEAPAVPFPRLLRLLRRQRARRAGPPLAAALQHRAACAGHGGGTGTWGALLAGPGAWMACAGDARAGRYGVRNGRNQWKDGSRCWLLQIYIYMIIYTHICVYHIILEWWNRSQVGTGTWGHYLNGSKGEWRWTDAYPHISKVCSTLSTEQIVNLKVAHL